MVDAQALTAQMRAQLDILYWISLSILHAPQDAQDAVQQGLLRAWAGREKARPDDLRAWLTRIVINECHNILRHRQRVRPAETIEAERAFVPPDLDVRDAVDALPQALRVPFLLKYMADFSEREVATATGLPVTTIKNRLHKARRLLRERLADAEVTFE